MVNNKKIKIFLPFFETKSKDNNANGKIIKVWLLAKCLCHLIKNSSDVPIKPLKFKTPGKYISLLEVISLLQNCISNSLYSTKIDTIMNPVITNNIGTFKYLFLIK